MRLLNSKYLLTFGSNRRDCKSNSAIKSDIKKDIVIRICSRRHKHIPNSEFAGAPIYMAQKAEARYCKRRKTERTVNS